MRGNSFGHLFTVTTFGESHGEALGVVIDGMPSNVKISLEDLKAVLAKRAPGRLKGTTSRMESDTPEILSGIFEGKTLGTPITVIVRNHNQKSQDYDKLKNELRPGHADQTTLQKFGIRDHRGGGRASGRETLSRVIGGYFASLIIPEISFTAFISNLANKFVIKDPRNSDLKNLGEYSFPDKKRDSDIEKFLLNLKEDGNSVGGKISLMIKNVPAGLGEPVFDKMKADLAKAFLSIGGCVGFTYGEGENFVHLNGKEISKNSHAFSGIEGGMTNGDDIYLELTFKAPSTVGEKAKEGRHDPCVLPRVIPVVEAMAKIVFADHFLRQRAFGEK